EFLRCYAFRYGGGKDEGIHGHPLYGKGLRAYGAPLVVNSRWLSEGEHINPVHPNYRPGGWARDRAHSLLFHDELFECIATSHQVELLRGSFERVLELATQRLFH